MMPDLGKYAVSVLTAYGASFVLLAGLVWISLWRNARVRAALRDVEARQRDGSAEGGEGGRPGAPAARQEAKTHG